MSSIFDLPERDRVVAVARSWLGTPYHPGGRVKGVGCDCLTLLAEVYAEAGMMPRIHIPYYPADWHLHRSAERYLHGLQQYAHELDDTPQQGDIALWKFGRCFSHGAIVVKWPHIIHACMGRNCSEENAEAAQWLGKRPVRFFSVF